MPQTKIIATLGPASSTPNVLRKMMLAGLDVVRLNFSHGSHEDKLQKIGLVRELNRKYRRKIRILGDLEGYRVRVGGLRSPIELRRNQTLLLVQGDDRREKDGIPFDYTGSLDNIRDGQDIYIDDGRLWLKVEGRRGEALLARVLSGGLLSSHKGVNMPGARLSFRGLTGKDRKDIRFCREQKIDFIAQSFVRNAADMRAVAKELGAEKISLIAKIENRQGVRNLAGIMAECDGVMVARGDLGVSLPIYEVPLIQKEMIRRCKKAGKFSITATQMLESMTANRRPTRAEVSDVANAILDGADYLMLSAESAVGSYPVDAVRMMNQIIAFTENYLKSHRAICRQEAA